MNEVEKNKTKFEMQCSVFSRAGKSCVRTMTDGKRDFLHRVLQQSRALSFPSSHSSSFNYLPKLISLILQTPESIQVERQLPPNNAWNVITDGEIDKHSTTQHLLLLYLVAYCDSQSTFNTWSPDFISKTNSVQCTVSVRSISVCSV